MESAVPVRAGALSVPIGVALADPASVRVGEVACGEVGADSAVGLALVSVGDAEGSVLVKASDVNIAACVGCIEAGGTCLWNKYK